MCDDWECVVERLWNPTAKPNRKKEELLWNTITDRDRIEIKEIIFETPIDSLEIELQIECVWEHKDNSYLLECEFKIIYHWESSLVRRSVRWNRNCILVCEPILGLYNRMRCEKISVSL